MKKIPMVGTLIFREPMLLCGMIRIVTGVKAFLKNKRILFI